MISHPTFLSASTEAPDLPVTDLDLIADWCRQQLGMIEVERRELPVPTVILERDGARLSFAVNGADASDAGAVILVRGLEALRRELKRRGNRVDEWGIGHRVLSVAGPAGTTFAFRAAPGDEGETFGAGWRPRSRWARFVTIAFALLATAAFVWAKLARSGPMIGGSSILDWQVLALFWVGVLWVLRRDRDRRPERVPEPKTLDNFDWHLDEVRKAGLPDDRAALVGGSFLAWLITRDHLPSTSLIGLDDVLAGHRAGTLDLAELYDAFGNKLTSDLMDEPVRSFATDWFAVERGQFADAIEESLGTYPFQTEPSTAELGELHRFLDRRYDVWLRSNYERDHEG